MKAAGYSPGFFSSPHLGFVTVSSPFSSTLASSLSYCVVHRHPSGARSLTSVSSHLSSKQPTKPVYCGVFDDAGTLQSRSISISDTPAGIPQASAEAAFFSHCGGIDFEAMRNAEIELFNPTIIAVNVTEGPYLPFCIPFGSGDTQEACN